MAGKAPPKEAAAFVNHGHIENFTIRDSSMHIGGGARGETSDVTRARQTSGSEDVRKAVNREKEKESSGNTYITQTFGKGAIYISNTGHQNFNDANINTGDESSQKIGDRDYADSFRSQMQPSTSVSPGEPTVSGMNKNHRGWRPRISQDSEKRRFESGKRKRWVNRRDQGTAESPDAKRQRRISGQNDDTEPGEVDARKRDEGILMFHGGKMSAVTGHAEEKYHLQDVADLPTSISSADYAAVLVGRNVYVLAWNQYVFKLNLDDLVSGWQRVQSTIYQHKFFPPAGVLNGKIYVCGGRQIVGGKWSSASNTCEMYTENAKWVKISVMKESRSYNCVVSLDGYIYSIGGQVKDFEPLKSVERYDPGTDKWRMVEPMKEARYDAASAVFKGKIYVLGGWDKNEEKLKTVEFFDPTAGAWTPLFQMNVERGSFISAVVFNRKLHVFGGTDGQNWMEILDVDKGEARKVDTGVGELRIEHRVSLALN